MSLLSTIFDYAPHLELIGKFGGAVAVLWGAKKYVVSPLAAKVAHWKKWCVRLSKSLDTLDSISKEFRVNGGASLKDDVTQIKERLTYIESLTSAQMEDDPQGVFISDESGSNSFLNRAYCRLLGASKDEVMGFGWRNFISHAVIGKYDELWKEAFLHNREFSTDLFLQKSDGKSTCCHIFVSPLSKVTDKNRRFLGRIKINTLCVAEKCLIGDVCPHRSTPVAVLRHD